MPSNPTTEGPIKSLRQAPPGGYLFPGIFAAIALVIAAGMVRAGPTTVLSLVISGVVLLAFLVPAYVLFSSARDSGLFVDDDRVEFRVLAQVRHSWPRSEVLEIKPALRGVAVVGKDGRTLREFRYRYWRADQVEALARSAGLAPASAVALAAAAEAARAAEPQPPAAPRKRAPTPRKPRADPPPPD